METLWQPVTHCPPIIKPAGPQQGYDDVTESSCMLRGWSQDHCVMDGNIRHCQSLNFIFKLTLEGLQYVKDQMPNMHSDGEAGGDETWVSV
jgi:hypothetical protein